MDFSTVTQNFTLAMLVKPDLELNSSTGELAFSFADTGGVNMPKYGPFMFWGVDAETGGGLSAQAQWNTGAWTGITDPNGNTLPAGEWSHIATRHDSSVPIWELLINGAVVHSEGLGGFNEGLFNMIIGSFGSGTADGTPGVYDDVGYWDKALSTAEMAELQVPEPSSIFLLVSGLFAVGLRRRSRS